ncbi:MAG: RNA methyltransferase [Ignavibacteriales bacterium]|nr:RNA methyltransferase [Ignavibacteriales bacterium]
MRKFKTDQRLDRIISTVKARQFSLRVVLENIHDPHNVSAIFRSCDAVGVPKVSLLYTIEKFPKINRITSASANKWIETEKFDDTAACVESLKREGFKIFSSFLDSSAKNLYELDLTQKTAIVLGNEHRGVSKELKELSDKIFYIPMHGMIQSLNASVAAAVTLYEAQRQRSLNGMYEKSELSQKQLDEIIDRWCNK